MPNEIAIRTDRGEYVGGDMMYGAIYVCIEEFFPARVLKFQFRGYEICDYEYSFVEQQGDDETFVPKTSNRSHRKDIVKADITLIDNPVGFKPGFFVYPFKYQLPHNLPGVFHSKLEDMDNKCWEGIIKYSVGAVLDTPIAEDGPNVKLHVDAPMIVFDSIDCRNRHMPPEPKRASGRVKTFFCISRGTVNVSSRLDYSAYTSKEIITVHLEIRNESAVDVDGLTVKLVRVIKLHGRDHSRGEEDLTSYTHYDTVMEVDRDGCQKNSTRKFEVDLDLTQLTEEEGIGVPPTTSGSVVKSSYVVDVDVHVPWAPDIDLRQPLIIKPLENSVWESWDPPLWVTKCVEAPVAGSLAVAPEDIFSASFSGIPGFQPVL